MTAIDWPHPTAEAIVRGLACLSVVLYMLRCGVDIGGGIGGRHALRVLARWLWTVGFIVFIAHVISAFGFAHGFSHARAYQHTAEQTAAVTGWAWGGGIYVNHLFMAYWLYELLSWWKNGVDWAYRSRWQVWFTHGLFAFMFFNATIVFGPAYWKWIIGGVACFAVGARAWTANPSN